MSKRTESPGLGSLGSGALTAVSLLGVTAMAALAGVAIARELGRSAETDGFFAAYGVFVVVVLAAHALRVAVLPDLARARAERRLAGETAGFALALAAVALPLLALAEVLAGPFGDLLTGSGSEAADNAATEALRWLLPAAVAHLFAGLAASALAALDDYATAAAGYLLGSAAGLALILARIEADGLAAVAWGMTLNAAVALGVPLAGLAVRALRERLPAAGARPRGAPLGARLRTFAAAVVLPLALQLLYVACMPFAGREGEGAQTSFAYGFLAASALVAVTASSLGLVTSVPLTRTGLDGPRAARHVVATSRLALSLVAGAAGALALVGPRLVELVLGGAYGGDTGEEVGRLIVVLSPWMVASVGVSVTFPLVFVAERTRTLPLVALSMLAMHVPLVWAGQELFGLDGIAVALALSTLLAFGGLLLELHALRAAALGVLSAAVLVGAVAAAVFAPFALALGLWSAAAAGLAAYVAVLALLRPAGLAESWRYLRALA
ncbi:MAG TPA: hypothetical protein VNJ53_01445 [Gaiellaceae bacterium]|nr:hypothetical protein [Gaiellaceae bacterium]